MLTLNWVARSFSTTASNALTQPERMLRIVPGALQRLMNRVLIALQGLG